MKTIKCYICLKKIKALDSPYRMVGLEELGTLDKRKLEEVWFCEKCGQHLLSPFRDRNKE